MQVLMWMVGCGPPEVDFSVPVPILRGAKLSWTTHEELVAKEAKQAAAELRSPRSVSDGTRSPTCSTCSSGCCSGHGGCL